MSHHVSELSVTVHRIHLTAFRPALHFHFSLIVLNLMLQNVLASIQLPVALALAVSRRAFIQLSHTPPSANVALPLTRHAVCRWQTNLRFISCFYPNSPCVRRTRSSSIYRYRESIKASSLARWKIIEGYESPINFSSTFLSVSSFTKIR